MNDPDLEERLRGAFAEARSTVEGRPDLFARVTRTLEDAAARRRWRWRVAAGVFAFVVANAALALALSDTDSRGLHMDWWVIELITNIVLIALAVGLGPFIKRFGRAYAADVFRANPRTGKSYLVLTDIAYYLIFTAFVLFTVTFERPFAWRYSTAAQLEHEVARVGGILLLMGVLHALNVAALPLVGRMLAARRTEEDAAIRAVEPTPSTPAALPTLTAGVWTLRIEPAVQEPSPPTSG